MSASTIALLLTLQPAQVPVAATAPVLEKVEAEGKVREVRSGDGLSTWAVLARDDKSELVLHGQTEVEEDELRSLAGVRIRIRGTTGDAQLPAGNHVRVASYDITDVGNGVVPRLGHIASMDVDGKPRVLFVDDDGNAELLPAGFVAKMSKQVGARAWMVGVRSGREFVPSRFGILRLRKPATGIRPNNKQDKNEPKGAATP